MKKYFIARIIALLLISTNVFSQVKYNNPILAGFYAHPGICRVGNDCYITTSTFAYFRDLPVFHRADPVNRKPIGNAMNRNEQPDQSNAAVPKGLFASTLPYYNSTYYIICTLQ
jgi:xylan 1,4-beta-xylosidase